MDETAMAMELRAALRIALQKRDAADATDVDQVGLGMAAELGHLRGSIQGLAELLEQNGTPTQEAAEVEWHYRPPAR